MVFSRRRVLPLLVGALLCSGLAGARAGDRPVAHVTGTVSGFDDDSAILTIETPIGFRQFFITNDTLIFLNGRTGDTNDFGTQGGVNEDEVDVGFHLDTLEAVIVRLTREQKRSGRITAADDDSVDLRLSGGGTLQLDIDSQSRLRASGVAVSEAAVLVGLKADAVFEPGSLLVIALRVNAQTLKGRVTAVDAAAGTITVDGPRDLVFNVPDDATIRRQGETADLGDVVVGDRVRVIFVKRSNGRRALVLTLNPAPAKP